MGRGPKGYRPSDERIREQVNERLTMHPEVDASEVDVRVEKGMVTLTGTVEDRHAKRLAEDIAEDVFGVDDVRNELRVRHGFFSKLMGNGETEMEKAMANAERETKTARTAR
jgi:osmotically-inducible protein OsmY